MEKDLPILEAGGVEVYGEFGMGLALQICCRHHHIPDLGGAAQDETALLGLAQNGHIQGTVGRIRVEVASDDGNAKFLYGLLHALQDLGSDGIISHGENIHHGHRPASHSRDVMDIDQNGAIARPLRIHLHEPGPDAIRCQEHDLIPIVDHRRILSK